jgi:hypothetical protein
LAVRSGLEPLVELFWRQPTAAGGDLSNSAVLSRSACEPCAQQDQ